MDQRRRTPAPEVFCEALNEVSCIGSANTCPFHEAVGCITIDPLSGAERSPTVTWTDAPSLARNMYPTRFEVVPLEMVTMLSVFLILSASWTDPPGIVIGPYASTMYEELYLMPGWAIWNVPRVMTVVSRYVLVQVVPYVKGSL